MLKSEYASNNLIFKSIGLGFLQANEIWKILLFIDRNDRFREVNHSNFGDLERSHETVSSGFAVN